MSVGLSVKEKIILTLKLKLTLFFVGLSRNASLWPFLHMLQRAHKLKPTLKLPSSQSLPT